ncbi:Transcription factor IIIA [Paramyrothecium foliicola]|nr:Transcription factor IIIA [Paramyrothecium foliicola]
MSKRSADGEAVGSSLTKRMNLGVGEADMTYPDPELELDRDDGDDDFSTAQTPSSMADAESTVTATTTPRPKFPSDLKTLACTWPGCPKTFNRPARLRDHLNSHTNSRPFKCPYDDCDKDYIEDKHLKQHIKAVHTHERKHVCQREGCGKSFVTGTRLKRHQAVHEGADRFRCQDCGQSFRKRETLNKHVRKDHQGLRAHPCTEKDCDAAFDSKAALKRHKEREHGELRFWCIECASQTGSDGMPLRVGFTTEVLLQAHMKLEHQTCMFCDFKSPSKWELDRHVEWNHSGKTVEDRKTIECPYETCDKKFTTKSNLTTHIRSAHEGLRFICGEFTLAGPLFHDWSDALGCGDKFVTKARLEEHVRFIHLGHERPKLSKPVTTRPDNIIDDISGVTNQAKQTIICPHCGETFIRWSDLNLHTSAAHGDAHPMSADPGLLLSEAQLGQEQNMFGNEDMPGSGWPGSQPEEEIFAASMDYGMLEDEWLQDEANILLLARQDHQLDDKIDPALEGL